MHDVLRLVVETSSTLAFVIFLVGAFLIYLWRSVKISHSQMMRLVHPGERVVVIAFLLVEAVVEPLAMHFYHFAPHAVASQLPDAALLAWFTVNVFSAWCIITGALTRSYLRALIYLPLVAQTFVLVFVSIDSLVDNQASVATLLVAMAALVGIWIIHVVPKAFQTTEEMLCQLAGTSLLDSASSSSFSSFSQSNYSLARILSKVSKS